MNQAELVGMIKACLFVAGEPVETSMFAQLLDVSEDEVELAVTEYLMHKQSDKEGVLLRRIGEKLQLCTNPQYAEAIKEMFAPQQRTSLSKATIEVLSIIAYRQPVTRAEVDAIRGVNSDYALSVLLEKRLICEVGRKDTVGKPRLYGTTDEFLRHFGMESLLELPKIDLEEREEELI